MLFLANSFAASEILSVRFRIGDLQQVGRNGPAIVLAKTTADVMAGGPDFRGIKGGWILQELLHPLAIWREHPCDVGLRPLSFAEPPHCIDGILHPHFPFVHPFNRARQFRGIKPVEVFREKKSQFITEADQYPEIVEASGGNTFLIGTPEIKHKAAIAFQNTLDLLCKLNKPVDVISLVFVSVRLLPLQSERRGRNYEIDALVRQQSQQFERVAAVCSAVVRGIGGIERYCRYFAQHKM